MNTAITIREYNRIGGNLIRLNYKRTFTDYSDKNKGKAIEKIEYDSDNIYGTKLFKVYFVDGTSQRYAENFILTEVQFVLADDYK